MEIPNHFLARDLPGVAWCCLVANLLFEMGHQYIPEAIDLRINEAIHLFMVV